MSEEDPIITPPPYIPPPDRGLSPDSSTSQPVGLTNWNAQQMHSEPLESTPEDVGSAETQSSHEISKTKELLDRAQVIGRVALSNTGIVVSRVQEHIVKGAAKARVVYSKIRENIAEKSVDRAIDSHYDAISSEIRIGEIRDAAIRTIDKSVDIPERLGSGTELAKGDFRSSIKELRMERKIDDHADAASKNKRLRNNTGTVRSPLKSKARRTKNRLIISKDFITRQSSAGETLTQLAENRGSSVNVEKSKVKRAGRAESSQKRQVLKYADKIEKRAQKRTVRAKKKIERKERQLEKRQKKVTENEQKLLDLEI